KSTSYCKAGENRVKNNIRYDLNIRDLKSLIESVDKDGICEVIARAYYMGIESGCRMTEKR
nr:hypothetical protein [Lachnospiraceae bacterium]